MDRSETYIKQCKQAEEIQELGKAIRMDSKSYFVNGERNQIHLPRQDELQGMIRGKYPRQYLMVVDFAEYCVGSVDDLSMEQLWLAFVMKKKYGKVWNGEQWVKGASRSD